MYGGRFRILKKRQSSVALIMELSGDDPMTAMEYFLWNRLNSATYFDKYMKTELKRRRAEVNIMDFVIGT